MLTFTDSSSIVRKQCIWSCLDTAHPITINIFSEIRIAIDDQIYASTFRPLITMYSTCLQN